MSYFYIKTENNEDFKEIIGHLKLNDVEFYGPRWVAEECNSKCIVVKIREDTEERYCLYFDFNSIETFLDSSKEVWYKGGKLYSNPDFEGEVDWSKAPYWARYAAKDADGSIYLFDTEPVVSEFTDTWVYAGGKCEYYSTSRSMGIGWGDSLEKRPESTHNEVTKEPKTYRDLLLLQLNGKVVQRREVFSDDWLDLKVPLFVNLARLDEEFDKYSFRVKG